MCEGQSDAVTRQEVQEPCNAVRERGDSSSPQISSLWSWMSVHYCQGRKVLVLFYCMAGNKLINYAYKCMNTYAWLYTVICAHIYTYIVMYFYESHPYRNYVFPTYAWLFCLYSIHTETLLLLYTEATVVMKNQHLLF